MSHGSAFNAPDPAFAERVRGIFDAQALMRTLGATLLMPAGADVLSVEFKVNLLRPAAGARFVASGRVIKPGHTLMVTHGDLWAFPQATSGDSDRVHVAMMQATMIRR